MAIVLRSLGSAESQKYMINSGFGKDSRELYMFLLWSRNTLVNLDESSSQI